MKPPDIIATLMQLVAILLPGALVAFVARSFAEKHIFVLGGLLPPVANESQGWVIFFFASYLLGHFVFLLASFLDEPIYDAARKLWKPLGQDLAYKEANAMKYASVPNQGGREVVNAFQWAKARLNLLYPAAMSEIKRHESDSKFFRSLVVVFLGTAIFQARPDTWVASAACVVLAAFSFWRYFDQRWKSTKLAYIYLLAMNGRPETPPVSDSSIDC